MQPICVDRSIAIVEQVRDGSNLRVRLLLPGGDQQFANIAIAGVRCPRSSSKQGEGSEKWGEEVRSRVHLHY
jgi:staphylococcal nuclease domain-containing protein 1